VARPAAPGRHQAGKAVGRATQAAAPGPSLGGMKCG
jgi:hypothetical protein